MGSKGSDAPRTRKEQSPRASSVCGWMIRMKWAFPHAWAESARRGGRGPAQWGAPLAAASATEAGTGREMGPASLRGRRAPASSGWPGGTSPL